MSNNERPITESGRGAVRLRGLFGGETEERASFWVRKIEEEAMLRQLERQLQDEHVIERSAGAAPLDVEIERMAAEWSDWTFMFGHQVYDPIRDSPGETKHRELVGKMIWWATARTNDADDHLIIKSAERQPSLAAALRVLRSRLPRLAEGTDR